MHELVNQQKIVWHTSRVPVLAASAGNCSMLGIMQLGTYISSHAQDL
jgi:hypothetical protein